jgi:hypothetical protein
MNWSSGWPAVPKEKQAQEGIDICVESIERLREIEGVSGFHIMAIEWEEKGARDREAGRALSPAAGILPQGAAANPVRRIE